VVAAHPDDETLGCGATMRLLSDVMDVHVAILGEGITSRRRKAATTSRTPLRALKRSCQEAVAILGGKSVHFEDLPDNRFDTVPLLDVVHRIESIIDRLKPVTVFTHHGGDLNVDHRITFQAVLTATRPAPGQVVSEVYTFEVPSSTEWTFGRLTEPFRPNVFVDVTQTVESQIQAMKAYGGEIREFPHPRSPELLRARSARYGSAVGCLAAEAFELVRSVRHRDSFVMQAARPA
jgi:LmbE family N-acetylglucosaminyl deacetylase